MLEVERGSVEHFNSGHQKMFGFIKPDKRRPNGRDVFFHISGAKQFSETFLGNLELEPGTEMEKRHIPRRGEKIVYLSIDDVKGPKAYLWAFASDWDKGLAEIAKRPSPKDPLTRILKEGTAETNYKPTLIWEGYGFRKYLDEVTPDLSDPNIYIEEFRATAKWQRDWHPKNWHEKYKPQPANVG
ncbi:cold shock domain-containing protein [Candidatus Parcubacteria bacterium]|nr:cold shock domain-containing protein [Candidatus Parcubacteria bacterium]